jgi:hypothetical protein
VSVPLQKAPQGVTGALNLKVTGRQPDEFSTVVQPTVETYDQYLQQDVQIQRVQGTITGPSVAAALSVGPSAGAMFRVYGFGAFVGPLNIADIALTADFQFSVFRPPGVFCQLTNQVRILGGVGLSRTAGLYLPRPMWLANGLRLQSTIQLSGAPTAPVTVEIELYFAFVQE